MAVQARALESWLCGLLEDDATLTATAAGGRVYAERVPPDAVKPCVCVRVEPGGADSHCVGGDGNVTRFRATVTALGDTDDPTSLEAIDARILALLTGISYTTAALYVRCNREGPALRPEIVQGTTRYMHLGGIYGLAASAL